MAHATLPDFLRRAHGSLLLPLHAHPGRNAQPEPAFQLGRRGDAITMAGALRISDAEAIWNQLLARTEAGRATRIELLADTTVDGASIALLVALRAELAGRGLGVELESSNARTQEVIHLYGGDVAPVPLAPRKPEGLIEHVGRAVVSVARELQNGIEFVGSMVLSLGAVARHPHAGNWREVPRIAERAGADAVPIVFLLNFLLGFVTGYEAIEQLRNYGANIYVADLVGLGVTRELAPLMTAIILAGRSGAGFAAELATMTVSDEVDALRTMGIGPLPYLVWPRALALVIVAPILTIVGDVVGVAGGMMMAKTSLDVTPAGFYNELATAIRPWDVASGIVKSCVFGAAIALIACEQGLATRGGAAGVGRRTTATVVISLVAVVLIDTLITVIYREISQ